MNKIEQEIVIKMEPEIHQEEEHLAEPKGGARHTKLAMEDIWSSKSPLDDDVPNENLVNMKNRIEEKSVHDGIKSYACFFCGKFFSRKANLKEHVLSVHEGQKNHKCGYCEKSYTESRSLKIHINTVHEGQRNYKCNSCEKLFSQRGSLSVHIKMVHEGSKNHFCDLCDISFISEDYLMLHNRHHQDLNARLKEQSK